MLLDDGPMEGCQCCKGRGLCVSLCERVSLRILLGLMKMTTEAWCKALYSKSSYGASGDSHGIRIPPETPRRLSEEGPLEGTPKLFYGNMDYSLVVDLV